jgi:signal transduction histidine kinase
MTAQARLAASRGSRGLAARSLPGARAVVVPAAVVAVACVAAAVSTLAAGAPPGATRVVLACSAACSVLLAGAAALAAALEARRAGGHALAARALAQRGQAGIQALAEALLRGEWPAEPAPPAAPAPGSGPFGLLTGQLEQSRQAGAEALLRVAAALLAARTDQRVALLVNLAGRMQSLVHREIVMLEQLESQVEDPVLLNGLFAVDHLATRMRRQSESLAVLGGEKTRRQWSRHLSVYEVMRAAVAEIEQFARVRVMLPDDGMGLLRSTVVTDVIHLVAELAENATKWSDKRTEVLLRAQAVGAGVAIDVEDRGIGMTSDDRDRMNDLLAHPDRVGVDELLAGGRIGLFVVAMLARQHDIAVRLDPSIYRGIRAAVIIPATLMEAPAGHAQQPSAPAAPLQRELAMAPRPAAHPGPGPGSVPAPGAVPGPLPHQGPASAGRRALPVREPQASLAPGLRQPSGSGSGPGRPRPPAGHLPSLGADFLGAFSLGSGTDGSHGSEAGR